MAMIRIREAAALLGVSDDTVRRWIDGGGLTATKDATGRLAIPGHILAQFARTHAATAPDPPPTGSSARNRFAGIVTRLITDGVMAEVELQCGPHTVVSLMSRQSAEQLGLEVGSLAVAAVKATTVIVEIPKADR